MTFVGNIFSNQMIWPEQLFTTSFRQQSNFHRAQEHRGPGASFSKVPIIDRPGKLSPFTLKIEVSVVLHLR